MQKEGEKEESKRERKEEAVTRSSGSVNHPLDDRVAEPRNSPESRHLTSGSLRAVMCNIYTF